MATITLLFLIMLAASIAFDLWLDGRQIGHIAKHRDAVPERFAEGVSLEAHQKAADYSTAKLKLGRIETAYSAALLLLWTLGGGLNWLDGLTGAWFDSAIWHGVAFLIAFFLISSLLDVPFSIYKTFVVEERFGFNRVTPKLFVIDMIRGGALMLLFGLPLAWVVLWLMDVSGSLWWLYAWAVWTGFSLFMMWAYPTFIAPMFNKFTPMEEGELKSRIETLLERCGFTSNGLFVMDGSKRSAHGNAYFSGIGNAKRIVFFDTLLKQLDIPETEAVLAHELGHFRRNHVKKRMGMMFGFFLVGFAILGWVAQQPWFYSGLGITTPSDHAALLLFMLAAPVFSFWLSPISSYYSRKHEFEADAYAVAHADGERLITALVRMYEDNASTLTPDPIYSMVNDSHPPAPIRVPHIEQCMAEKKEVSNG
jgi:STE24 endopeptidase